MKTSEMLVKYAGPYLEGAASHEQRQSWLNIACTAWNIAVLPRHKRKRALSRYLEDVRRYNPGTDETRALRHDIETLMKEKRRMFPEVRRPIVEAEIIPNGDKFSIRAVSMRVENE